ncbi:MAG: LLM class F420-dependent oxidoreductase [Caulobacteraceae bacterium]|nr:LLM class F420-dependent oxidoreductase [Caulobacteraceae bacterium]
MKIGAVFPSTDIGADVAAIRDFAQTAEGLGYSHLLLPDHVLGAVHEAREPPLTGPYTEKTEFHEPLTTFAYLAAITTRIEFSTGILILPQRQTALVAKQAAQVALLSGDRFRMGVGVGWNWVEYEALNETWEDRGRRQEEQIELLKLLWTKPVLDYRGKWHRIDRAGLAPLPKKPIPIWLGGYVEAAWRRAARLGDGFIFPGVKMTEAQAIMDKIRGWVAENGRDPAAFGFEGAVMTHAPQAKWSEHLESWRRLGATHVVVRAMTREGFSLETPQDHIRMLETWWRTAQGG